MKRMVSSVHPLTNVLVLALLALLSIPAGTATVKVPEPPEDVCVPTLGHTCTFKCVPGERIWVHVDGAGSGHARCAWNWGGGITEIVVAQCETLQPPRFALCTDTSGIIPGVSGLTYDGRCTGFDLAYANCYSAATDVASALEAMEGAT